MIPRELVGTAAIPGQGGKLTCYRHDRDFFIHADDIELMSSRVFGSEEELAELALHRVPPNPTMRVLVGGLGMGFTLARALALVGPDARVDVAELVPEVVTWNRDLLGHCAGHPLQDPRAHVLQRDVVEVIAASPDTYDALLLDVDNGPEGLVRQANDRLYLDGGLHTAKKSLRKGGVAAYWSSRGDSAFAARMRRCGFDTVEHRVRARRTKGPVRTIWVGVCR